MMQQLATQRSQIAAFPETLPESAAVRDQAQTRESVLPEKPTKDTSVTSTFQDVLDRQRGEEEIAKVKSKNAKESAPAEDNDTPAAKPATEEHAAFPPKAEKAAGPQENLQGESNAMPDKVAEGAEKQAAEAEAQISASQMVPEYTDNIALPDSEFADMALLLGGNTATQGEGEPDYLALVDAVRALQDKLSLASDKSASSEEEVSAEDIISMLPTEIGKPIDGDVLAQLQDWLNSILPADLPTDIQASPLQQMRGAEQVLSDLLTLVKQIKAGAESQESSTVDEAGPSALEKLAMAEITPVEVPTAEKPVDEAQLTEENLVALAMALLQGLPNERRSTSADTSPGEAESGSEPGLLSDIAAANVQLAEEPVVVAEATDEALVHQATLLVSLMRQVEQGADTGKAETKPATESAATKVTDMDGLAAILSDSTDKTLQDLAQVMTDSASKANPALTDTQLSQMRSQLTTGLEEMRSQLKQGHQPGLDLAALVQQVAQDIAPQSTQNIVLPVMQDVQQLTQLASMAGMSQGQEQQLNELVTVARDVLVHETRQQHGDSLKSMQQQSVFDKPVNVQQTQGQQQIAEKIRWMVNGRQSMAEIRLDPPEMGSMQIRLNVSGDSASVSFVVQSQQAKEALNEAMPRLRDMFSEQGLNLGESFVSQQNSGEAGDGEFADQPGGGFNESGEDEAKSQETHVVRPANGLIDDYV